MTPKADMRRWKEVVFRAKEAREKLDNETAAQIAVNGDDTTIDDAASGEVSTVSSDTEIPLEPSKRTRKPEHPRLKTHKGRIPTPDALPADTPSPLQKPAYIPEGFCQECFIPLVDDPDPETLFIYLHALRYTTDGLGRWETPLPRWAGKGWKGDWRGWSEEDAPGPFEDIKADKVVRLPASKVSQVE